MSKTSLDVDRKGKEKHSLLECLEAIQNLLVVIEKMFFNSLSIVYGEYRRYLIQIMG